MAIRCSSGHARRHVVAVATATTISRPFAATSLVTREAVARRRGGGTTWRSRRRGRTSAPVVLRPALFEKTRSGTRPLEHPERRLTSWGRFAAKGTPRRGSTMPQPAWRSSRPKLPRAACAPCRPRPPVEIGSQARVLAAPNDPSSSTPSTRATKVVGARTPDLPPDFGENQGETTPGTTGPTWPFAQVNGMVGAQPAPSRWT